MVNVQLSLIVQKQVAEFVGNGEIVAGGRMVRVDADHRLGLAPVEETRESSLERTDVYPCPFRLCDLQHPYGGFGNIVLSEKRFDHRLNSSFSYHHATFFP